MEPKSGMSKKAAIATTAMSGLAAISAGADHIVLQITATVLFGLVGIAAILSQAWLDEKKEGV